MSAKEEPNIDMKLSVIIVSYKVPYFLEQALSSVYKAAENIATEIIVIDNNSRDETVGIIKDKFPEVILIENIKNTGFATANNQGIEIAVGEFILFLNPDTVVREDTFEKVIDFMQKTPDAGGLGVKMIDGTGNFLPESKRGFPSPQVAFYKTFGLSKFFPKSKWFNQYHLGYLDKDKIHKVDVLSGAFLLIPRNVLNETGYWDEDYFMYGEDIDLSYRIKKAGYNNYYFPETTIIHYKGESTKKGSLNYVITFYEAMIIFAKKHFLGSKAGMLILMLKFAIYFRASLSLISRLGKRIYLFLADAIFMYAGMIIIKNTWAQIRFHDPTYYDNNLTLIYFSFPFYIFFWILTTFLRGGYDKHARTKHVFTGILLGTICITSIYALFPEDLRSSRMLILLGALWALIVTYFNRSIISLYKHNTIFWSKSIQRNVVIVGDFKESNRVLGLLHQTHVKINFIGIVSPYKDYNPNDVLGSLDDLKHLATAYKATEIIFCGKDISFERIIFWMTKLGPEIKYKIVPQHSTYIIGSNSKNSSGELYAIDISFKIANSIQRRNKRILDLVYSFIFLLSSPLIIIIIKNKLGFLKNIISVILQKKTWVGYSPVNQNVNLPKLLPSVLTTTDPLKIKPQEYQTIHRINLFYAKDYSTNSDLEIILKAWRKLGRQSPPSLTVSKMTANKAKT